jgi:uncharacterized glyoxalase superfamily protein PhnB
MVEVNGLAGVIVSTSSERFAEMEAFYLSVVGAHVRSRRPGFVNFDFAGLRLTISVHDGVVGSAKEPARTMINLAVVDVDATADRLAAQGAPIIRPPEDEIWGGRMCTVADPDGNYLQFMTFPRQ